MLVAWASGGYVVAVSESDSSSSSLAGSLLIAHPGLLDPNFRRTVLLLADHTSDGTFGLILNRPTGRTLGELLPNKPIGALAQIPVLLGGPVQSNQLVFASFHWSMETDRMHCRHHLMIPEAQEALEQENTEVRAFIGYAGWTGGQLEAELQEKSWLISQPTLELFAPGKQATLWREVTSGFGPWFKLIAEAPDDPSEN